MRLLYAATLILALAAPARAQWAEVPTATSVRYDYIQGGPGFLLRYDSSGDNLSVFYCSLSVSRDGGLTFAPTGYKVPSPLNSASFSCRRPEFTFDTALTGEVLAYLLDPADARGVFRTSDGVTWTRLAGVPEGEERLYPRFVGGDVVAHANAAATPGRVVRLAAGASTWTDVAAVPFSSLPGGTPDLPIVMGSVVRPGGGRRVYARSRLSNTPLVYTSDDLQTWTPAPAADSLGTRYVYDFGEGEAVMEASPYKLAAAIVGGQITFRNYLEKRTTTGGSVWRNGFAFPSTPSTPVVSGSAFTRIDNRTAFSFSGVSQWPLLLTRDRGTTWTQVDTRTADANNPERFYQTDGRFLFYVDDAQGGRLWRRPLADYALTTAGEAAPETRGVEMTVGPNPARGAATLRVTLAEAQSVRVTLTDVLGRDVPALDRALPAGASSLPLDVSRLAPGVYAARLVADGASASVRLTVAR